MMEMNRIIISRQSNSSRAILWVKICLTMTRLLVDERECDRGA